MENKSSKSNHDVAEGQRINSQQSAMSERLDVPDFFLYTTLNQNQTKDLRKARTNRDERLILSQIFELNAIPKTPTHQINKVDQIILDFHYINYDFCSQSQYSNEKVSTLLGIMNFVLHTMIKKQMNVQDGAELLKQIMSKHLCQRPPFTIYIFTEKEAWTIQNFMMRTFFRHYSLYEYSFKPKIELILQTLPKEDKSKIENQPDELAENTQNDGLLDVSMGNAEIDITRKSNISGVRPSIQTNCELEGSLPPGQTESQVNLANGDGIDWQKVGKIYKPESAVEHIISQEMKRLNVGMGLSLTNQDDENEEKFKGKKK